MAGVRLPRRSRAHNDSHSELTKTGIRPVSFGQQDLTLEVIGFGEDGTPYRFVWVDDDLWASDFQDYDPRIDTYLPAGTHVLAVAEYNGATPQDLMIAVDGVRG
jgi:hypothetical protein